MSTQINVIVDDGGLSAKARQQTQANRWAQMEAEARAKAEQKAKEEQAKQDVKTGTTQDGQRSRSTFRAEEPAAFRRSTSTLGHWWWFVDKVVLATHTGAYHTGSGTQMSNRQYEESFPSFLGSGSGNAWQTPHLPSIPLGYPAPPTDGPSLTAQPPNPESGVVAYIGTHRVRFSGDVQHHYDMVALPCGNGSAIVAVCTRNIWNAIDCTEQVFYSLQPSGERDPQWPDHYLRMNSTVPSDFAGQTGKHRGVECFVCSSKGVRPIPTPAAFDAVLREAWPEPTLTDWVEIYDTYFGSGQLLFSYPVYQLPPSTTGVFSSPSSEVSDGFLGQEYDSDSGLGYSWTPKVFEVLNGLKPFTSPSLIKSFPSAKRWLMADRTPGSAYHAFALHEHDDNANPPVYWSDLYNGNLPLQHARWLTADQTPILATVGAPSLAQPVLKLALVLDPARPERKSSDENYPVYRNEIFGTVWDWDDPGYCRQMCAALGFTAADLQP